MPRLKNAVTGVQINVSDEKAASLPSVWVGADAPAQPKKTAAKKAPSKKEESNG
jgi:hypothetical protein